MRSTHSLLSWSSTLLIFSHQVLQRSLSVRSLLMPHRRLHQFCLRKLPSFACIRLSSGFVVSTYLLPCAPNQNYSSLSTLTLSIRDQSSDSELCPPCGPSQFCHGELSKYGHPGYSSSINTRDYPTAETCGSPKFALRLCEHLGSVNRHTSQEGAIGAIIS